VVPASIRPISASLVVQPVDLLPMANASLPAPPTRSLPTPLLAEHVMATVVPVQALNSTNARHVRPIDPYSRTVGVYPRAPEGNFSTRLRVVAQAATAAVQLAPPRVLTNA
jgi:hypothetical protein